MAFIEKKATENVIRVRVGPGVTLDRLPEELVLTGAFYLNGGSAGQIGGDNPPKFVFGFKKESVERIKHYLDKNPQHKSDFLEIEEFHDPQKRQIGRD